MFILSQTFLPEIGHITKFLLKIEKYKFKICEKVDFALKFIKIPYAKRKNNAKFCVQTHCVNNSAALEKSENGNMLNFVNLLVSPIFENAVLK